MAGTPLAPSSPELAGRRVLVTGAGSGIGLAEAALSAHPVALAAMEQTIPMGRLGAPNEIGELIGFLLGARASFITGQVICADGGFTAR